MKKLDDTKETIIRRRTDVTIQFKVLVKVYD